MADKQYRFKRLSIGTDSGGRVLNITQPARTLSEALTQELDYFQKAKRTPAEIIITKED